MPRLSTLARAALVLFASLAALSRPVPAAAEAAGATDLFRRGVEALQAGEYPEAASLFRLSYDMERRAATQCNLALTYERWGGHDLEALEAYRRCAEDDTDGRYRPRALERAQEIRRRLDASGGAGAGGSVAAGGGGRPPEGPAGEGGEGAAGEGAGGGGSAGEAGGGGSGGQGRGQGRGRRPVVISHPLLWAGVAVAVLAAGSFGTAIGLHVWAQGIYDDLSERHPPGNRYVEPGSEDADAVDLGGTLVGAALGLYITGGVLAAAATVLIAIDLTQADSGVEASFVSAMPLPGGLMVGATIPLY